MTVRAAGADDAGEVERAPTRARALLLIAAALVVCNVAAALGVALVDRVPSVRSGASGPLVALAVEVFQPTAPIARRDFSAHHQPGHLDHVGQAAQVLLPRLHPQQVNALAHPRSGRDHDGRGSGHDLRDDTEPDCHQREGFFNLV